MKGKRRKNLDKKVSQFGFFRPFLHSGRRWSVPLAAPFNLTLTSLLCFRCCRTFLQLAMQPQNLLLLMLFFQLLSSHAQIL